MPKIQASSALSRFRVLDLSRVRAGPNCVRVLTDFGADVIRIEPPPGVDPNEVLFQANRSLLPLTLPLQNLASWGNTNWGSNRVPWTPTD